MGKMLMTGFPGFLGSALLPRIMRQEGHEKAVCLVQGHFLQMAQERVAELEQQHPELLDRVDLVVGDITAPGLGLEEGVWQDVVTIWHLAAVYDLAVAKDLAWRVNVDGTANVVGFAKTLPNLRRLQYVSTCYVAGEYDGRYRESDLDVGQKFLNHYESTKYAAEVIVHDAAAEGLPVTVYRPGIVVGDSTSGATQKYDGPYYLAHLMKMQPAVALIPQVGDPDAVTMSLVPRDFVVDAMAALSGMDASEGKTYALTTSRPPTIRELVDTFGELLGRKPVWVPLPLTLAKTAVGFGPMEKLLGIQAAGVDYFAYRTTFDTTNTQADLAGTGITCPDFADYAPNLIRFFLEYPDVSSAAMV